MVLKPFIVGELETNAYVFSPNDRDCCIIDPGEEGAELAQYAAETHLHPRAVIFTHGHLDHVLGAAELISALHRKDISCPIYIHASEAGFTGPGCLEAHTKMIYSIDPKMIARYTPQISRIPKANAYLEDGMMIPGVDLQIIHTPGHSPGSVCLYHSELGILFSGDTLFNGSAGRTDLAGGDGKSLLESLQRLAENIPDAVRVYPGHGPETDIMTEKQINPFIS